jgi:hypothetical protein
MTRRFPEATRHPAAPGSGHEHRADETVRPRFRPPRGTLDRLDGTVMVRRSAADRARTGSTADGTAELPVASYETFTSTEVLGRMAIPD